MALENIRNSNQNIESNCTQFHISELPQFCIKKYQNTNFLGVLNIQLVVNCNGTLVSIIRYYFFKQEGDRHWRYTGDILTCQIAALMCNTSSGVSMTPFCMTSMASFSRFFFWMTPIPFRCCDSSPYRCGRVNTSLYFGFLRGGKGFHWWVIK